MYHGKGQLRCSLSVAQREWLLDTFWNFEGRLCVLCSTHLQQVFGLSSGIYLRLAKDAKRKQLGVASSELAKPRFKGGTPRKFTIKHAWLVEVIKEFVSKNVRI